MHEGTSQTQRARRALLALCTGNAAEKTADVNGTTDGGAEKQRSEDNQGHQRNTLTYHQSTEEPRLAGDSLLQGLCRSSQGANQPIAVRDPSGGPMSSIPVHSQDNAYAEPTKPPSFPPGEQGGSHGRCVIVAPGRLEHDRMVQAQKQHLVFRRLWSQLEREQVRQARYQRKENQCATRLKGQREAERKMQERECCLAESNLAEQELMEDREKAEQWAVLLALEERKHRLTKAKENERFIEALREKVKQRMIQKHSQLPALCACARTFWETDPDTCANNCIFYKNEKGLNLLCHLTYLSYYTFKLTFSLCQSAVEFDGFSGITMTCSQLFVLAGITIRGNPCVTCRNVFFSLTQLYTC